MVNVAAGSGLKITFDVNVPLNIVNGASKVTVQIVGFLYRFLYDANGNIIPSTPREVDAEAISTNSFLPPQAISNIVLDFGTIPSTTPKGEYSVLILYCIDVGCNQGYNVVNFPDIVTVV